MPTSATSPQSGNTVKDESPEPSDERTCRVDASADSNEDLRHSLVPLAGDVPRDSRYFWGQLNSDSRGLLAKTMRFVCKSEATLTTSVDVQDKARDAIWSKTSQMLRSKAVARGLPRIIFNELPLAHGTRRGIIDLVFPSMDAWDACCKLNDLHIEGVKGKTHTFSYQTGTRTLPGNILAVQCLGLPIDDLDSRALLEAFGSMSSAVGTVLGLVKIVITSEQWDIENQFSGAVRFYIEIDQDNMAISWSRLIKKLPTHFQCNGFPYALSYVDRDLHREDVFSSDYTVPRPDEKDSKSSIKRSRTSDESANSSTSRRKKVKKQEEEEDEEEE